MALLGNQGLELALDHLSQAVGNGRLERPGATAQRPAARHVGEQSLPEREVDDVHQEQRVALGAVVDQARQVVLDLPPGEPAAQVGADVVRGEWRQQDVLAAAARLQLLGDRPERRIPALGLRRPVRADEQQVRERSSLRHVGDQLECRMVAPVQVLEHEDHRTLDGDGLEQLGHLAQHALAGGALHTVPELAVLGRVEQRGELRQPCRRVLAKLVHQLGAAGVARQARPGLEDGEVGFAGAVLLHRLSARDVRVARAPHALEKRVHQGGLPDPGRSADEDRAARSPARQIERLPEPSELLLAPDHLRLERRQDADRRGFRLARPRRDLDGEAILPVRHRGRLRERRGSRRVLGQRGEGRVAVEQVVAQVSPCQPRCAMIACRASSSARRGSPRSPARDSTPWRRGRSPRRGPPRTCRRSCARLPAGTRCRCRRRVPRTRSRPPTPAPSPPRTSSRRRAGAMAAA